MQLPPDPQDNGVDFLREEVLAAIHEMKNNKAEGIDNIPVEMMKELGDKAINELVKICNNIYNTGEWPDDFLQSIFVPLKKKPNAMNCGDYRTITLISHASKIIMKMIAKRIRSKAENNNLLSKDQFGFRRGMGTRDAIGTLRIICDRMLELKIEVFTCFVDYEKAFDRVNWKTLMSALERLGVDWKDRRLIRNLYLNQSVRIRIDGTDSAAGKVGRGVRQGCPLSPLCSSYIWKKS